LASDILAWSSWIIFVGFIRGKTTSRQAGFAVLGGVLVIGLDELSLF